MTEPITPAPHDPVNPTRRDRLRPLELIGFAGVLAVFAGGIVFFATREWVIALITLGAAFIVTVMTVALVGLGGKPSAEDLEARKDLHRPEGTENWH